MTIIRRLILAVALIAGSAPAFAQPAPVPALPDAERRTSYTIGASLCNCAVGFQLYGDSTDYVNWLEVFVNGVLLPQSGNWTITSPTGPISTIARPITDAVLTFSAAQTGTVQIVGARRPRRTTQFQEGQPVPTRNFNQTFSDIIAIQRELWDKTNDFTGRSVRTPPGETLALLPALASRANMGACFDNTGNLTSCIAIPAGSFAAGNGITFTGTGPTTLSASLSAGPGLGITGTNPLLISILSNNFGARCDVVSVVSASVSIASGSPNLTVTGASFAVGDIGKVISIPGAGTTSGGIISTLNTTILSVTDGTHVVLNANAATALVAAAKTVIYGTNDSAAFQSAMSGSVETVDLTQVAGCMLTTTLNLASNKTINGNVGQTVLYLRQLSGTSIISMFNISTSSSFNNLSFNSDSGSTITLNTSAGLINANGNAIHVNRVYMTANRDVQLQPAMIAIDVFGSNTKILNSHFINFPSIILHANLRASNVLIQGNKLERGPKVSSAAGFISFNSVGATGTLMGDIRVVDNYIDMTDLAVGEMNVGLFVWGGDATTFQYDEVVFANNNVLGAQGATGANSGGVILFNTTHATVTGNNIKYTGECIGLNSNRTVASGNTLIGCGTYGIEAGGNDITISNNIIDAENQTPFGMSVANCVGCTISNNVIDATSAPVAFIGMQVYVQSGAISTNVSILGNQIVMPAAGTGKGIYLFVTGGATKFNYYTVVGNTISNGGAGSEGIAAGGTAGTQFGFLIGPNSTSQAVGVDVGASFTAFCYIAGMNISTTKTAGGGFPGACL